MDWITANAETMRCITFSDQETGRPPAGQQLAMWLPAGKYRVIGIESITVSDLGTKTTTEALRIERGNTVYYVGKNANH